MIYLQPLGSYLNLIETLAIELEKKFYSIVGNVKIMPLRELDKYCYNPFRKQYNSTCLLFKLEKRWITLGITEVDIYADNMNFVFGEAEILGSRALVSAYRLRGENFKERLLKECTHEIGHVLGLKHCSDKSCVMAFSNSVYDVDKKSDEFCEVCRRKIKG